MYPRGSLQTHPLHLPHSSAASALSPVLLVHLVLPSTSPLYPSLFSSALQPLGASSSSAYNDLDDFHSTPSSSPLTLADGSVPGSLPPFPSISPPLPPQLPSGVQPPTHRKECWTGLPAAAPRLAVQVHPRPPGADLPPRPPAALSPATTTSAISGRAQGSVSTVTSASSLHIGTLASGTAGLSLSRPGDGYEGEEYQQGQGGSPLLFFKDQGQAASSPPCCSAMRGWGWTRRCVASMPSTAGVSTPTPASSSTSTTAAVDAGVGSERHHRGTAPPWCATRPGRDDWPPLQAAGGLNAMPGMRKAGAGQMGGAGFDNEYGAIERQAREREIKEFEGPARSRVGHGMGTGSSLSPVSSRSASCH